MIIKDEDLEALSQYANDRYAYLLAQNGFNEQAPNKYALRNRALMYALGNRPIILKIGAYNNLCTVKLDIAECKNRAIHYGVKVGDAVGVKVFPLNWLKPTHQAYILRALKRNWKF